jgi:molybdate transport system substrate-binding protein
MKILCSNGVKSVMLAIAPTWERRGGASLAISWGSTLGLMKEINSGAAADLAILTDEAIDELIGSGKAAAASRVDLARSGIGVAVRKGAAKPDISTPEALKRTFLAARSIAHSKTGMSGIYFPTVLQRLGIADAVQGKIVIPESGMVGDIVAKGDAELGIQQISELLPVAGVEIVGPLPAPLQKITVFSAGVLTTASDRAAGKELVDFIAAASRPLLAGAGLEAP